MKFSKTKKDSFNKEEISWLDTNLVYSYFKMKDSNISLIMIGPIQLELDNIDDSSKTIV